MGVKIALAFSSKVKCNSFMYNIIILVCRTGYFRFHTNPRRLRCLIPLSSELYGHNRLIEVGGRGKIGALDVREVGHHCLWGCIGCIRQTVCWYNRSLWAQPEQHWIEDVVYGHSRLTAIFIELRNIAIRVLLSNAQTKQPTELLLHFHLYLVLFCWWITGQSAWMTKWCCWKKLQCM